MKTWKICVEDGPHQHFYVKQKASTLEDAINKVQETMKKEKSWLHIMISPAACGEIK